MEKQFLVVAIDGGAASGKSSTSRSVAEQMNFLHVDTGTHYRALTRAALNANLSVQLSPELERFLTTLKWETAISNRSGQVCLNGEIPKPDQLRTPAVNQSVSNFAALPAVREAIRYYQRNQASVARSAGFAGLIMDGRDIGTVIFPDADLKVFLKADLATRHARRTREGQTDNLAARDSQDTARADSPLRPAEDALIINNSDLTLEAVVKIIVGQLQNLKPTR